MPKALTEEQLAQWNRDGAVWPIDLLTADEAADYTRRFEDLETSMGAEAQSRFRIKAHLPFPWLWDLVTHPRLADAVEDLIGPNIVCWGSSFFTKKAHDPRFISWHQDSTYYGLEPPESITAWVAFTRANAESGCMKIIPGSHTGEAILPHEETYDENNLLSRGQTIRDLDTSGAVDMPLEPGQMSIHNGRLAHGSGPNSTDDRRIGLSLQYMPTSSKQTLVDWDTAALVRGVDNFNHFEHGSSPESDLHPDAVEFHAKANEALRNLIYLGAQRESEPSV